MRNFCITTHTHFVSMNKISLKKNLVRDMLKKGEWVWEAHPCSEFSRQCSQKQIYALQVIPNVEGAQNNPPNLLCTFNYGLCWPKFTHT
jgi:hypothetical protein